MTFQEVRVEPRLGTVRSSDGLNLHTRTWDAPQPVAQVVLVHGYAEHAGRYGPLAERLAEMGFAVRAFDLRGHGLSEGERANVRVFRAFVDDLKRVVESLREAQPALPRVVFGHSVGGLIAAQFALEHPQLLEGLVLSSPYFSNAVPVSPLLLRASGLMSRLLPALPTLRLDSARLARDPAVAAASDREPLVYRGGAKARLGHELLLAGAFVLARASEVRLPLLIVHGEADGVADPAGSRTFFERSASSDKTLRLEPEGYHELFNDHGREAVLEVVRTWLEARFAASGEASESASTPARR